MYSVWHNYLFILLFLSLATSFSLHRPSSGQHLQKLKNASAYGMVQLVNSVRSHSHLLLFFIINTSFSCLNKGWPTRWHLLYYVLLNMFQTLIRPSSGACDYLLRCVGWLEACWCYVVGLSVGDVVSECRLNHYGEFNKHKIWVQKHNESRTCVINCNSFAVSSRNSGYGCTTTKSEWQQQVRL